MPRCLKWKTQSTSILFSTISPSPSLRASQPPATCIARSTPTKKQKSSKLIEILGWGNNKSLKNRFWRDGFHVGPDARGGAIVNDVFSSQFQSFVALRWMILLRNVKILGTTSRSLPNMTGGWVQVKTHEKDFETETAAILVTALRPRWETKQQSSWRTLRRGLSSWPKSTQGGHLFVLHLILCCRIMKRFHAFLSWLGIPKHLFNDYKVLLLTSVPTRIETQCSGPPSLQNCLRVLSRIQNNQRQARISFEKTMDKEELFTWTARDFRPMEDNVWYSGCSKRLPRSARPRSETSLVRSCMSWWWGRRREGGGGGRTRRFKTSSWSSPLVSHNLYDFIRHCKNQGGWPQPDAEKRRRRNDSSQVSPFYNLTARAFSWCFNLIFYKSIFKTF